jgi:arylsulfatase
MIRWPGRIRAGQVSDQIFASLDWLPTLAAIVGEQARIPKDRPIDGIDQSAFLRGEQAASNREYVIYYIGEDLFAVKWRQFKIHFKTVENLFAPVQQHLTPLVYDIRNDPGEQVELLRRYGFSHAWVMTPVQKILGELQASMQQYRNINPGEDFKGY